MLKFPVSVEEHVDLLERMRTLQVHERDFKETFSKPSGVNLFHIPSGIRVRSAREHSQGLNRYLARCQIVEELEARQHGKTRHSVKAERLREEKDRRDRKKTTSIQHPQSTLSAAKRASHIGRKIMDHLGGTHLFDSQGDAMAAYFLRPLS